MRNAPAGNSFWQGTSNGAGIRGKENSLASIIVSTHGPLTIRTESRPGEKAIRASGDLDITTAPALESSLLHAFEGEASSVVVDLTEIRFIDGFGVRVVRWAQEHARREGDRIRIAGSAVIRRVLPSH